MNKVNFSTINFDGTITEDKLYNEGTEVIKSEHLPSFVDDVVEYDSLSDFPEVGEGGKIYVAKDTGKTYRWSGSAYILVSSASSEDIQYDPTLQSHTANSVGAKLAQLDEEVGDLTDLTTTAKTNIVAAVNEVNGHIGDIQTFLTNY